MAAARSAVAPSSDLVAGSDVGSLQSMRVQKVNHGLARDSPPSLPTDQWKLGKSAKISAGWRSTLRMQGEGEGGNPENSLDWRRCGLVEGLQRTLWPCGTSCG
ncbi:hypothetical protein IG631_08349 [Alternaria alternata]|nr:hypothetical protein IG631_08349 [Alternaria alternata]